VLGGLAALALGAGSAGCDDGQATKTKYHWEEEVELIDKRVIVVRQGRGSSSMYDGQSVVTQPTLGSLKFTLPEIQAKPIEWKDRFQPLILNVHQGAVYVAGSPWIGRHFDEFGLGWAELDSLSKHDFAATVFRNTATGETVISIRGTDFGGGATWQTVVDTLLGSAPGALSQISPQVLDAISLYVATRAEVQRTGGDVSKISFTGHSLGGGLASLKAVWFGHSAEVFAQAPFQLSALNPLVLTNLYLWSPGLRTLYPSAADFVSQVLSNFNARESLVRHHAIKGEFLESSRSDTFAKFQDGNQNAALLDLDLSPTLYSPSNIPSSACSGTRVRGFRALNARTFSATAFRGLAPTF
jgi:hypothetical protein